MFSIRRRLDWSRWRDSNPRPALYERVSAFPLKTHGVTLMLAAAKPLKRHKERVFHVGFSFMRVMGSFAGWSEQFGGRGHFAQNVGAGVTLC